MTAASRARFAEVVRAEPVDIGLAAALIAVEDDPGLDVEVVLGKLDELAVSVRKMTGLRPEHSVRLALAGFWGEVNMFRGEEVDWEDLRSSLLPHVIRRKRGLPLLLSMVWVEAAKRCGFEASYAAVPGRVVVSVPGPSGRPLLFDPLEDRFFKAEFEPMTAHDVLLRLLTNIRALAQRKPPSLEAARMRLWAVELSLLLPVHPVELRRERGELLVRLGRHVEGAEELEAFADVVDGAEPEVAELCRREARQARARLN